MEKRYKSKIGLLFGSFNPIHVGHLVLANYFYSFTSLEEIWFVVSPHNPLKQKESLIPAGQRLKMVQLAVEEFSGFSTCDVEFLLPAPSYTIDTLQHLQKKYPEKEFILIIGEDNMASFNLWKDHRKILDQYEVYVYNRSGNNVSYIGTSPNVTLFRAPLLKISSTFIRDALREGKNMHFFLPEKVSVYIEENKLYSK